MEVVEYDPRRPVFFDGSEGRVTFKPNEDAPTPLMSIIRNSRLSANDVKKLQGAVGRTLANQTKKDAQGIGQGKGDGRSRSRGQQSRR